MAQEFEAQFCFRCLQKECARSQHGKSRFEARVSTWETRLFDEVPRMNEQDPRFVVLRSKKFVDINTGAIPEIGQRRASAWVDPRDLDVAPESPHPTGQEVPVLKEPSDAPKNQNHLTGAAPPPPPPKLTEKVLAEPPRTLQPPQFLNTPVQQGRMLGGMSKPEPQAAPRDPWEVKPAKDTKGLPVVQPGARIKIGGAGV